MLVKEVLVAKMKSVLRAFVFLVVVVASDVILVLVMEIKLLLVLVT